MQIGYGDIGIALLVVVGLILASAPIIRFIRARRRNHW